MFFTQDNYAHLHRMVFSRQQPYPGYRPEVKELPNGDGKVDEGKRYAHISTKNLVLDTWEYRRQSLRRFLVNAHSEAMRVAIALGVPRDFMPAMEYCALRVLEYPVGAGAHPHTDFDLFTLMLYRDRPENFISTELAPEKVRADHPQFHMGELGEILGLGRAPTHHVEPADVPQHSIVYFAIPSHYAELPTGLTVGAWIAERIARSRTY
jgi:hypothetical protein